VETDINGCATFKVQEAPKRVTPPAELDASDEVEDPARVEQQLEGEGGSAPGVCHVAGRISRSRRSWSQRLRSAALLQAWGVAVVRGSRQFEGRGRRGLLGRGGVDGGRIGRGGDIEGRNPRYQSSEDGAVRADRVTPLR
jgi:hypothetical protein